nr:immunoglobulin heavy chain junction region [Mus musculus]
CAREGVGTGNFDYW